MSTPRVLICTVTSWSDQVGGDTYSSLFDGYDIDKIANLYIREEMPNSTVCSRYFYISESRLIRSVLDRSVATGKELLGTCFVPDPEDVSAQQDTAARYEKYRRKRRWFLLYAREVLWKLGRWKTPELDAFLDDFRPDVVLFGMEGYIHFNRINRYIVRRTGASALGYFYDDNFTYKQRPWSLGYRIYRFFQRRDLKKTARLCSAFFAISPKTKKECDEFFGIDSILLTKPVRNDGSGWTPYTPHRPIRMLYTGNLLYGRLSTLRLLGEALSAVNDGVLRIHLDVFTNTSLSEDEIASLGESIRVHAAVPQGDVVLLQRGADILLFMEDLLGPDRMTARLSFSTKLTDYLQTGKCIFAVGRADIAPIEYLRAEDAAICATSAAELSSQLHVMVAHPEMVSTYGERAYECGRRNHSELVIAARLRNVLDRVCTGVDSR